MFSQSLNTLSLLHSDNFFFKLMFILNLFAIVVISLIPSKYVFLIKQLSLLLTLKLFLISFLVYVTRSALPLIAQNTVEVLEIYNNKIAFSCDSISLLLIVLTTFLTFICLVISLELANFKLFSLCFLIMQLLL